jgi:hypothetical protein
LDVERAMTRYPSASPVEGLENSDLLEPSWLESARRYRELAEVERAHQWVSFHEGMCELHRKLSEEHTAKARALQELLHARAVES